MSTGLGAFLAIGAVGLPLVVSSPARAGQETAQSCGVGKPRPHYLQRLAHRFDDRGNKDPADDRLVATLTLCGRADSQAAYKLSLDVRSPLFTDADRNGNGQVGRKDFCVETRDAVVRWPRRLRGDLGGDGVTSELVPGQGGLPDAIRFTVRVKALERALGEKLPRDGSRAVFVWAHARPRAAAASPYAYVPDRRAVDMLPVPDLSDGCARPQAAAEALAVTLTDPATQTFDYTGNQQTYTVPAGVSSLQLTVTGATGGSGSGIGGGGGKSAQVTGLLSVTPGQQLTIDVGGAGGNATGTGADNGFNGSVGAGGPTDPNGIPGGPGGLGDGDGGNGGGGGAASFVSTVGGHTTFVIAGGGGGGGGGGCFIAYVGGGGGGAGPNTGPEGGFGISGSGTGGGTGGAAAWYSGPGDGAYDAAVNTLGGGGGGGGGGYFGGEGGGAGGAGCGGGGGGGAGSNYTHPSVTGVVVTQTSLPTATNGSVVIDPQ